MTYHRHLHMLELLTVKCYIVYGPNCHFCQTLMMQFRSTTTTASDRFDVTSDSKITK